MINLDSDKIDQSRAQLFLVLSGQVSRWHRENGPESRMMGQTAIFTKLLERNTDIDKAELWYYFNRLGWYEKDEKYLIQMKDTDRNDFIYARLIHQIPQIFSNCYILRYADSILLILNTAHVPLDKVLEQLRHILKESHISLGISYPFRDLEELPQSLQQAGIALHYGIQNRQTVNYCEEFMLDYVKSVFHQQTSYDLVHPALRQMEQYDQQHHTQYFLTLKAYLTEERSLARTAAVLQIHKNTLLYRIKKIEEKFHLNLDDKNQRLQILISYYILMT